MAYVKAVVGAFVAALLLGAVAGLLTGPMAKLPEAKAVVYAMGISEALNCAALFALVLVPLAVLLVFAVRRWRRRATPGRTG